MTSDYADLIHDWNVAAPNPARAVHVLDDTLRDGLQSPSASEPTLEQKKELMQLAHAIGVNGVVLGLPGAGPRALQAVVDLANYLRDARLDVEPVSAVRTHQSDIDAHLEATQRSGVAMTAGMFLGSSPIRFVAESWTIKDLVALTAKSVRTFVRAGVQVMFITEDTTRARPDDLRELYTAALAEGASRLCVADTCGHADPSGVVAIVGFVRDLIQKSGHKALIDWHGHNDRGLALINALTAVDAGADRIHATGLGLGERAGNAAMDQLLVNLQLKGQAPARNLAQLARFCGKVHEYCGAALPYNYPVVGRDAFRTATGVHAAAIVKLLQRGEVDLADRVYSAVPAATYGMRQAIEIGPMSGQSNAQYWLSQHFPDLLPDVQAQCMRRLLEAAKVSSKVLNDAQLTEIVVNCIGESKVH